ncbi:hypothetical protein PG994_002944 [Apiospora phragmitis]|uniref:Uncharacterized protein n=1 Tax=Apiospora phragmitis TaxID=2905665 RepID=A0ABR1W6V4_9PEZI
MFERFGELAPELRQGIWKTVRGNRVYAATLLLSRQQPRRNVQHLSYSKLRDEIPACTCEPASSGIWIHAKGNDPYLLLWELDANIQRDFIQDIYFLHGEAIWKKYNIREFAWATFETGDDEAETGDDETNPALAMMVDPTKFSSATYTTGRTQYGDDVKCMVLDGKQAAEACKTSRVFWMTHSEYPWNRLCLVDNDADDEDNDTDDEDNDTMVNPRNMVDGRVKQWDVAND